MGNHDKNGRFAKGNSASPGRPRRATRLEYTDAIMRRCTPEVWENIVARAVMNAEGGDKAAREWLEKFLIGTPPPMIDLPLQDMNMLAFVLNSLKERGADLNEALSVIIESATLTIRQGESADETDRE